MQQVDSSPKSDNKGAKKVLNYLGWIVWGGMLLLFAQSAYESIYENEIRAAMIYATITGLLLLGGLIVYFSRKYGDI